MDFFWIFFFEGSDLGVGLAAKNEAGSRTSKGGGCGPKGPFGASWGPLLEPYGAEWGPAALLSGAKR